MNFLYPSFLLALTAVSIPIIIHLVELRRTKRVLFTNLSFIKEVKNITASHRRLRQWLILLTRICFIVFLVLLFSQPYISTIKSGQATINQTKVFIDNSLSMQNGAKEIDNSLLQESIHQAHKLADVLPVSSSYQIGTNSKLIYADLSAVDYQTNVNSIKESANNRSVNSILSWFDENKKRSPYKNFMFSDFQRTFTDLNFFQNLDTLNEYYLMPLAGVSDENLFIDTVYSEDAFIRQGENNKLQVRLRNAGTKKQKACQVKFFVGDKQVSALNVTVPAAKTVSFALTYRLDEDKIADCKIVIEDFPVTFDNIYYFTIKPSGNIKILEVNEKNILTNKLYTNERIFQYVASPFDNINYKQINQADLIILNGAQSMDASLLENITTFVREGGNLIIIPAEQSNITSYSGLFTKLQINGVQQIESKEQNKTDLSFPNLQNPFFKNIFTEQNRNTVLPKATRLWHWSRSANDILTFKKGNSFLSSFQLGAGKVYLFASPLTERYTDFQNHALFVPVMYKIAMLSAREQQSFAYSLGSRILTLPFKQIIRPDQIVKLRKDSVEFVLVQQARKNQLILNVPAEANEAGFYELTQGNQVLARLAFNYDKRESDLKQFTAAELRTTVKGRKNVHVLDASDELGMKKELGSERLGVPLWKYCLILCLIFMLTEILLIRYF